MSTLIDNCAGHVHMFSSKGNGVGFLSVKPPIPNSSSGKCLILGIPVNLQEIVQPTVTLDEKRTIYVFGSAWSEASIAGVLLLGDRDGNGEQLRVLADWYDKKRISKFKKPVSLSLGRKPLEGYITGLVLGTADPNFNTMPFTINTLVSDV